MRVVCRHRHIVREHEGLRAIADTRARIELIDLDYQYDQKTKLWTRECSPCASPYCKVLSWPEIAAVSPHDGRCVQIVEVGNGR